MLSLATYGTVELAIEEPGGGISTVSAALPLPTSTDQPLEVQVIAQQWWFTYRYPTYGGIETAQLVLPVGQKIEFNVTSLDVVHSFNFYALGVKADAVPLNDNVGHGHPDRRSARTVSSARSCAASGTATWPTTPRWSSARRTLPPGSSSRPRSTRRS